MWYSQQVGSLCPSYQPTDKKFITADDWQNCRNVQVSSIYCGLVKCDAGGCFTLNQRQTPFVHGVLCTQG